MNNKQESLARFLNQISQIDIPWGRCSKKIQDIYRTKAGWIIDHLANFSDAAFASEGGIDIVDYKEPNSRSTGEEIGIKPELSVADVLEEMDNAHDHY